MLKTVVIIDKVIDVTVEEKPDPKTGKKVFRYHYEGLKQKTMSDGTVKEYVIPLSVKSDFEVKPGSRVVATADIYTIERDTYYRLREPLDAAKLFGMPAAPTKGAA